MCVREREAESLPPSYGSGRRDGVRGVKGVAIGIAFAAGVRERRDEEMVRERVGAQ